MKNQEIVMSTYILSQLKSKNQDKKKQPRNKAGRKVLRDETACFFCCLGKKSLGWPLAMRPY